MDGVSWRHSHTRSNESENSYLCSHQMRIMKSGIDKTKCASFISHNNQYPCFFDVRLKIIYLSLNCGFGWSEL